MDNDRIRNLMLISGFHIQVHTCACILHTCINTKEYICTHHTPTLMHKNKGMHMHTSHTYTHAQTQRNMYAHTYTHVQTQRNTRAHTIHLQIKKISYNKRWNRKHSGLNTLYIDLILSWNFISLKQTLFPIALEGKNLYNQHQSTSLCSVLF